MICVGCGKTYDNASSGESYGSVRCFACTYVTLCFACGKPWAQHSEEPPTTGTHPRMPCLGLRAGYHPRVAPKPSAAAPKPACADCRHYRMALHAVASLAAQGVTGAGLGDIAELALNLPDERSET